MWGDLTVIKEGEIPIRDGKQKIGLNPWKTRHIRLVSGYILISKHNDNSEPMLVLPLKNCSVSKDTSSRRDNTFGVRTEEDHKLFAASNQEDCDSWVKLVSGNALNGEVDEHMERNRKRGTIMEQAKKNVAGKIMTTGVGKEILRKEMDEEVVNLLSVLKTLLTNEYDVQRAETFENHLIKLLLKAHFAIEKKLINLTDFQPSQELVKKIFILLAGAYTMEAKPDALKGVLARTSKILHDLQANIEKLMEPVLSEKNYPKIKQIFDCISDANFLNNVYTKPANRQALSPIHDYMSKSLVEL